MCCLFVLFQFNEDPHFSNIDYDTLSIKKAFIKIVANKL